MAVAERRVAGRGGTEGDRVGGRERNYYTPHSVKNLTKLASWVVEIEEAIGSSWRKDLPSLLVEDFFFPKKHTLPGKANKNFKADLEELNYSQAYCLVSRHLGICKFSCSVSHL